MNIKTINQKHGTNSCVFDNIIININAVQQIKPCALIWWKNVETGRKMCLIIMKMGIN